MKRPVAYALAATVFGAIAAGVLIAGAPAPALACTDARIWTDVTDHSCLQHPQICIDGSGGCAAEPRVWTQNRPGETGLGTL